MTPTTWAGLGLTTAIALLALALWRAARAVEDLTDVLGHDHDTRWHYNDPPEPAPGPPSGQAAPLRRRIGTQAPPHPAPPPGPASASTKDRP